MIEKNEVLKMATELGIEFLVTDSLSKSEKRLMANSRRMGKFILTVL